MTKCAAYSACMASILGLFYRIKLTHSTDPLWSDSKVNIM